ncbi:MAG: PIN domain-containing protein [Syntrophomonas sp.]
MHYRPNLPKSLLVIALALAIWAVSVSDFFLGLKPGWKLALGTGVFIFLYLFSNLLFLLANRSIRALNRFLDNTSIEIVLGGAAGLFLGMLTGVLSSYPLSMFGGLGAYLTLAVFVLSASLGLMIGARRAFDVLRLFPRKASGEKGESSIAHAECKVLDTSAIIDGRIYDVCLSGFLEGILIVPIFVIEELQHIADSSDNIRRNKGRRGLELLGKMQKHPRIKIDIIETDIAEEKEVDAKLIRVCKDVNAAIITNDYNLNKVAELQGIKVLNINELTNAVKVMVYPGETMHTSIVKEGKEAGQGVGYLEDGTMVVAEDADNEIGNDIEVMVTSVFQTAAGRMIFTRKVKEEKTLGINQPLGEVQEVNLYG